MAAYRNIYQFSIVSQNGDDVDIFISKKNYAGVVQQRSLGRAPILKRERNGNILGTSLEIYAECKVDGEFSQLYTSSADEFLVEVYRSRVLLWTGFVSPELYSEPDIAPPYDVQIIATDGLGELKNYDFVQGGNPRSFLGHLNAMLAHTSLDLGVEAVSSLEYYDDGWSGNTGMMSVVTDMSHREGEDCYEVMQSMLSSVNAVITQQGGKWMVVRESDMHVLAGDLSPVAFGAMTDNSWWPVGNLSTDIIPAKKSLDLISENHYKTTVLDNSQMNGDASWTKEYNALYDVEEGAYRLPVSGSTIRQKVNFHTEVGYRLALHISARNIGNMEDPQMLGVIVKIDGRMYQAGSEFWLVKRAGYEDRYIWANTEQYIEVELPASAESDTRSDAQDIDIVIPLYKSDNRSYAYATAVEVSLYNVSGNAAIAVYGCSLSQYDRSAGNKISVTIGNDAREDAGETNLAFSDGDYALAAADVFRNAIPLGYDSSAIIKKWRTPAAGEGAYLSVMASDYAMQVALPRMRYRGKLNVPSMAYPVIPMIFERDTTYYFLNTYSYDLLNDELEVELISIPNASVTIESETVTELPSAGSASGSSSGSSGGGGGSSTLAGLADVQVDNAQNGQALVYENGYWVPRTVSGGGSLSAGAIIDALGYTPLNADQFTKANLGLGNVDNIAANKYFTALSSGTANAVSMTIGGVTKNITAATLKTSLGLAGLAYQASVPAALGYTPFDKANFTKENIKSKLEISDWALEADRPSYSKSDVGLDKVDNLASGDYFTALSSDTTNAISATVGGTNKKITAATLKASLGLGSLAYLSEIPFTSISDVVVSNPSGGQLLSYDAVRKRWVNKTFDIGDHISAEIIVDTLGYEPFDSAAFTKSNIKNALGIADWALAAKKPSYTWTDIGSRPTALSAFTNDLGLGSLAYKSSLVASDIPSLPWSKITSGKPTTLSGYGITDGLVYSDYINLDSAYRHIGYGYTSIGWKTSGPAAVFGTALYNLRMQCAIGTTDTPYVYVSQMYNGEAKGWAELVTYEGAAGKDFEALRYKIGETYVLNRSGNDTFLNYGNRTTGILQLYGTSLYFTLNGSSIPFKILDDGKVHIAEVPLTRGPSGSLKAGAYEAFQYFSDEKLIMHRNVGATGTYINYGGRTEGLTLYGSALSFNIGDTGAALILSANKDASFAANLTVAGNMYSKNYPAGKALLQDPTSAFISTIFDADAVGSSGYRLRIVKALEAGFDRIVMPYSPMVVIKSNDTHGFISFGYNEAGRTRCYIGGGNADKLNWSAALFHDNMSLLPKDDNTYALGDSSHRWSNVNAVNINASGNIVLSEQLLGKTPVGGTYPRIRFFSDASYYWMQIGSYDGLSAEGSMTICGIYGAGLKTLRLIASNTIIGGASQFVSLATFDAGIKIGDATLTWDATAGMLKIDKGIYSEGAITAKKKA